jgi:hypothetical protein
MTIAPKASPDAAELLRAARRVVVSLGYEDLSDHEGAAVLLKHAEALRLHRSTGSVAALRLDSPASISGPVEGELPVGPEDVRALLAMKGLSICPAGELALGGLK